MESAGLNYQTGSETTKEGLKFKNQARRATLDKLEHSEGTIDCNKSNIFSKVFRKSYKYRLY